MKVVDLLLYTNINVLPFSEDIPAEIITFLDPTVEYLHFNKEEQKVLIYLKFRGKDEILLNNPMELNQYLSSGTIRSIYAIAQKYSSKDKLVGAIKKYNEISKIPKGEWTLLDLLKD